MYYYLHILNRYIHILMYIRNVHMSLLQIVDIFVPKYLHRDYIKANVYTIWIHGPLALSLFDGFLFNLMISFLILQKSLTRLVFGYGIKYYDSFIIWGGGSENRGL